MLMKKFAHVTLGCLFLCDDERRAYVHGRVPRATGRWVAHEDIGAVGRVNRLALRTQAGIGQERICLDRRKDELYSRNQLPEQWSFSDHKISFQSNF